MSIKQKRKPGRPSTGQNRKAFLLRIKPEAMKAIRKAAKLAGASCAGEFLERQYLL